MACPSRLHSMPRKLAPDAPTNRDDRASDRLADGHSARLAARGGRLHRPLRTAYHRAGRALYVRRLRQLPPGRPVALVAGEPRTWAGPGRSDRAPCRLLGLHRLEGPLRQGPVHLPPAQARTGDAREDRLYAAGVAAG